MKIRSLAAACLSLVRGAAAWSRSAPVTAMAQGRSDGAVPGVLGTARVDRGVAAELAAKPPKKPPYKYRRRRRSR